MKTLGVLAGLGPLAGAHFYRRLIELTAAANDEEHIPVVLISEPSIPSRIRYLEGVGDSPAPKLQEVVRRLAAAGAEWIVIPSSTTHIFYPDLAAASPVPILSLISVVTSGIVAARRRTVGILATTPTRSWRVYDGAFAQAGLEAVYPDDASQNEITEIIARVKGAVGSGAPVDLGERLLDVAGRPWSKRIDGLLLACTEIPVVFPAQEWAERSGADPGTPRLFSSTDMLAQAVINAATAD